MSSVAVQRVEDEALKIRPIGPRVLVVDGEESIRLPLSEVLPPGGYAVYRVRNEKEALRRVQSVPA